MSILNQSVTPHGRPAFPPKGTISQDTSQHLSMVPLFHEPQSLRAFQSLKKNALSPTSAGARQGESFSKNTDVDFENHKLNGILDSISQIEQLKTQDSIDNDAQSDPFNLSFLRSLMENEKSNLLKDVMGELDLFSPKQNDVLVVAVSSAVKLETKQLDQIAKKIKRMTGSSNMRLENRIDPALIAGFIITYEREGSHVIDLSVKGQLAELAARIESTDQRTATLGELKCSLTNEN